MDMGTFRGLITLVLFLAFIGLWIWAWSGKRKKDFDRAARMPLDDTPAADRQGDDHE